MNQKSEQINIKGEIELAIDERLFPKETKSILASVFGSSLFVEEILNRKLMCVHHNGRKSILLCCQISYLGNPHPIYKKRVQLKSWFMDIYNQLRFDPTYDIKFIGIYRYKSNQIFVDFEKETYLNKKMHNSSAHVYTIDLIKGMQHGYFAKTDYFNNEIKVVSKSSFKDYIFKSLEGKVCLDTSEESKVLALVDDFNKNDFKFNAWIEVQDAIKEMKFARFKKWKECEWAGFYLEYRFSNYMVRRNLENYIKYMNNETKDPSLDFDIKFNTLNFYGDLKSSSSKELTTMLNDVSNIENELKQYDKLWYLIYEHDTIHDKDLDNHPYTKKRLNFIRQYEPDYKKGNDLTYATRLKAKVKYTKMYVVEINKYNYKNLLEKMTSNFHQINHGEVRKPKFKLTKQNIQNAIIYCYDPRLEETRGLNNEKI